MGALLPNDVTLGSLTKLTIVLGGVKAVTTDLHILDSAHDVQQQLKQPLPRKECRQQAAQSIVLPNIFEFENSTF